MNRPEDLTERLEAGNRGLQLSSEAALRHHSAIGALLEVNRVLSERSLDGGADPSSVAPVPEVGPNLLPGRLRLAGATLMVCSLLLGLSSAFASGSSAVPGDTWYGLKEASEQLAVILDGDIAAVNRIEELATLVDRNAEPFTISRARDRAHDAVERRRAVILDRDLAVVALPDEDTARRLTFDEVVLSVGGEGATVKTSLPTGDILTISAEGDGYNVRATGWWVVSSHGSSWAVSDGATEIYRITPVDGGVKVIFLAGPETGPGVPLLPTDDESPTAEDQNPPPTGELAIGPAAAGSTSDGSTVDVGPPSIFSLTDGAEVTTSGPQGSTVTHGSITESGRSNDAARPGSPSAPTTAGTAPPTTRRTATTSAPAAATTSPTTSVTAVPNTPPITVRPTTTRPTTSPTTSPIVPGPTTTRPTTTRPTTTRTTSPTTRVTTTTTIATTTPPTTAPPAPVNWNFHLLNHSSGNTRSASSLPMGLGQSPTGALANFDTNRDDGPGLLIQKDGAGLGTGDSTKYQEWRWTFNEAARLDGSASLTLWLAAKDFKTDERIGVVAGLDLCNPGCSRLDTGTWSGQGAGGFRAATINFGSIDVPVAAGSTLRIRIASPDNLATTDLWVAFGSSGYDARLRID